MANTKISAGNPLTKRYPPNNRFIAGSFKDQVEIIIRKDEFGESVTDKESYRLSLASKRGSIGTGSSRTGVFMFNDGKYDPNADFSYVMRKDLSIVEIDNYIERLTEQREKADLELKKTIDKQLANTKKLKAEKQEKENPTPQGEE